jgi:ABC-2 type transport system permease protein
MRNIWLVMKREVGVTFRKRSFWLLTFLMPAVLLGFNVYYVMLENDVISTGDDAESTTGETGASQTTEILPIGLVDAAGLIQKMPDAIPPEMFVAFPDQAVARESLEAGKIQQYVYIPKDYIDSGEITIYDYDFQILASGENMGVAFQSDQQWMLDYLLNANLVGDEQLVTILRNPTPGALAEYHQMRAAEPGTGADDEVLAGILARVIPYLYYFILIISSGYMLQSVTAEKENRTVELLLLSLRPRELMIGKILGLSLVVLFQIAVWLGGYGLSLRLRPGSLDLSQLSFPPGFLVWLILFLVLGYFLYASVMAAAGAVARTAREGGQMTWLIILPLMPTLMFADLFADDPHGLLVVILSLFPFSAPSAMITRMAIADVPIWQVLVSLLGLALTAYLFVVLAGRFFQAGNLLSTEAFKWRRFVTAWRE